VIATIPILTHHIPHALVVMVVMYLVTGGHRRDSDGLRPWRVGRHPGPDAALLAWMVVLDIAWLRIECFVGSCSPDSGSSACW